MPKMMNFESRARNCNMPWGRTEGYTWAEIWDKESAGWIRFTANTENANHVMKEFIVSINPLLP